MIEDHIDELIRKCKILSQMLKEEGLSRPSKNIDSLIKDLSSLCVLDNEKIVSIIGSKRYKEELDLLFSAVSEPKGFKDIYPRRINYEDWVACLNEVAAKILKIKSCL